MKISSAGKISMITDSLNRGLITRKEAILLLNGAKLKVIITKLGKLFYQ